MTDEFKKTTKEQLREIHRELEKRLLIIKENIEDREKIENELHELIEFTMNYEENIFTSKLQHILIQLSLKNAINYSIKNEIDLFLAEINKWKIIDSIIDSIMDSLKNNAN